ncbi:nucleotide-diphospho-sugar transferase [Aureobasidium subglaciale]|nr:nucleotide-diphospho-sugar transferase [Aureobasidium subglaciale]KAI5271638.1 nucleotide-diphospho-sugar transferase [Aureobasidium subglaciale]
MISEDKSQLTFREASHVYEIVEITEAKHSSPIWYWCKTNLPHLVGTPLSVLSWVFSIRFLLLLWRFLWDKTEKPGIVAACYFATQVSLFIAKVADDGWRLLCTNPRLRPRLRLSGPTVPRADVIITTCGEDIDVVMDTVRAACDLDYPADSYRILVADDAANQDLEIQIAALASKTPVTLLYYSRPVRGGMKAGNMNSALTYLQSLGAAEYCTFCDVDMVFEPEFLRATLPLLVVDERVGVAVVPQRFYNVPTNDPLYQSLNVDGKFDEIQRDSMNCAWVTGPGVVFRYTAVRDIGGFPENALAEDIITGFTLQGRGWKVVYCREELQFGLVPDTFKAHVTQRMKWFVGRLRNSRKLDCAIASPLVKGMTWKQRVSAICHCASPIASMMNRPLCSWIILLLIASGKPLITASSDGLRAILLTYLLTKITTYVEELLASTSCGYLALRRRIEGMHWLHTHLFFALAKDLFPKKLSGPRIGFIPTALAESKIQERHPDRRPAFLRRLRVMFLYQDLWYHVAILFIAATIFTVGLVRSGNHASLEYILTHLLVPGAAWSSHFASLRPISYAVSPPTMPERRDLMYRDIARSRSGAKQNEDHLQLHLEDEPEISTFEVWRPRPEQKLEKWDAWAVLPELPRHVGLLFWFSVGLGLWK